MPESLLPMLPVQFLSQGAHMAPSETTSRLRPEASVLLGFMTVPFLLKRAPAGPLAKPCCCSAAPAQRASLGAAGKPFCPALSQKREPGDSGSFSKDRERCFSLNSILGTQKWESGETSRGRFGKHIQGASARPFLSLKVLVTQSCPTLFDPMDCSSPGSSVHGILQARILKWVAIPFSRGSSQPRDPTRLLHCRQIPYCLSHLPVSAQPLTKYKGCNSSDHPVGSLQEKKMFISIFP